MAEVQVEIARIIKDVKGSLSCPVCFGTLISPLTIKDCGHALCSHCVKGILGANNNGRCPVCKGGTFTRRRGTIPDTKLFELIQCINRLDSEPMRPNDLSKTDGFLMQGPKLGHKKKMVGRKRKDRPVFSLESNSEALENPREEEEPQQIAELLDSPSNSPQVCSVSLLQEETEVQGPIPTSQEPSNPRGLSLVTLYPPPGSEKGKKSKNIEPKTTVRLFFDPDKPDTTFEESVPRRRRVCYFYQLSSMVPKDASKSKYPSIIDILRRKNREVSFKTPSFDNFGSTPLSARNRKSSDSSFKQVHHRRLVNDSTPSRNRSSKEEFDNEYGTSRRLSKEKILAAEPITRSRNQTSKANTTDHSSSPPQILEEAHEEEYEEDDEDFPDKPMSLRNKGSEEMDSTQAVINKMNRLKALAAELDKKVESGVVPPSDEDDDEIFPSTPELLPKKKKRPSMTTGSLGSARKRLKTNEEKYAFPLGTKIMSSALYTESDNSIYGTFRDIYQGEATFMSGSFDKSIDILVVGTLSENDNRCNRTVKYLYALACGKLIVSLDWIRECIKKGHLLDPVQYIVKDYSGSDGPRISYYRNENSPPFFANFEFGLIGDFESDFGAEEIAKLIRFGGGRLVRNLQLMVPSEHRIHLLIADKDIEGQNQVGREEANRIIEELGVATIDKDWVVESMGKYSPEMIDSYLINDIELLYSDKLAKKYFRIMDEKLED